MTSKVSAQVPVKRKHPHELTPEEAASISRIGVFIKGRWIAVGGVAIAALLATQVFNVSFPLLPVFIICAFMVAYNIVLILRARTIIAGLGGPPPRGLDVELRRLLRLPKVTSPLIEKIRAAGNIHIALDLVVLTILLHFTGGVENPFIFYFVFHVIIAGILLHYRVAYVLATFAVILATSLVGLEYYGVIPHVHLEGFSSATLYQEGTYILGVLVSLALCLYASAYMVSNISGELRKRQREVVGIRDSGLKEKTK